MAADEGEARGGLEAPPILVVVEPNARGVGGHYLDYVLSFRGALAALKIEARMLAARDADPDILRDLFVPTFRYGFWDAYPRPLKTTMTPAWLAYRALHRIATRLYYHPKTLAWTHRRGRRSLRGWASRALRLPMSCLNWLSDRAIPAEARLIQIARGSYARRRMVATSLREMKRALALLGAADPILFFTTAGENELRIAIRFLRRNRSASAILMVRRPLFFLSSGQDVDYALEAAGKGRFAMEIQRAQRTIRGRVQFVTDTDELTSLHNLLGIAPFETLPIPHIVTDTPRSVPGHIEISYLGDARTEKGFLELPKIAQALAGSPHADRCRLFIQCNFNIPGGEPGIADAVNELREYHNRFVVLHDQPLSRAEYCAQMARSDLMLLLYDRDLYRHRSSGILIESLSAGAVPVVPSGSWMESVCRGVLAEDRAAERSLYREIQCFEMRRNRTSLAAARPSDMVLMPERSGRVLDGGDYYLAGQSPGQLLFRLPSNTPDALDISFSTLLLREGHIFDLEIEFIGDYGQSLLRVGRQRHVYRATTALDPETDPDRFDEFTRPPPGSRYLRLGFGNTYGHRDLIVSALRLVSRWVASTAVPPRPRGVLVYGDVPEVPVLMLDEIARRLNSPEMPRQAWAGAAFHNPETFSELLLATMRRGRSAESSTGPR